MFGPFRSKALAVAGFNTFQLQAGEVEIIASPSFAWNFLEHELLLSTSR